MSPAAPPKGGRDPEWGVGCRALSCPSPEGREPSPAALHLPELGRPRLAGAKAWPALLLGDGGANPGGVLPALGSPEWNSSPSPLGLPPKWSIPAVQAPAAPACLCPQLLPPWNSAPMELPRRAQKGSLYPDLGMREKGTPPREGSGTPNPLKGPQGRMGSIWEFGAPSTDQLLPQGGHHSQVPRGAERARKAHQALGVTGRQGDLVPFSWEGALTRSPAPRAG